MRLLYTCLFLFVFYNANSCSCIGNGDFCTTAFNSHPSQDFIIMGKKLSDFGHGMSIEVIKSYRNNIEKDTITVWGDPGWLCRVYVSRFTIGETYIFKLYQIDEGASFLEEEKEGDFIISICGWHYLTLKEGNVTGFINNIDAAQTIDLETFETAITESDCEKLSFAYLELEATFNPNPFNDRLIVRANHRISEIQLYDLSGRLLYKDSPNSFNYALEANDLDLSQGMYIVKIIGEGDQHQVRKLLYQ